MDQYLLIDLVKALSIVAAGWSGENDGPEHKVFKDAHDFVQKHGRIFKLEQVKVNLEKQIKELKNE